MRFLCVLGSEWEKPWLCAVGGMYSILAEKGGYWFLVSVQGEMLGSPTLWILLWKLSR